MTDRWSKGVCFTLLIPFIVPLLLSVAAALTPLSPMSPDSTATIVGTVSEVLDDDEAQADSTNTTIPESSSVSALAAANLNASDANAATDALAVGNTRPTIAPSAIQANAQAPLVALAPSPAAIAVLADPTSPPTVVHVTPSPPTLTTNAQVKAAAPPTMREYTVRDGDQLVALADRFGASIDAILRTNGLSNPDRIQVGQVLRIPLYAASNIPLQPAVSAAQQTANELAPAEKIIPDSEAVYSPSYAGFNVSAVAQKYQGFLAHYSENVDGVTLTGPQIVQLIAERFSVGPRVLLTLLEMHGGWLTARMAGQVSNPFGLGSPSSAGLYQYLFYTASYLNEGYYAKATGVRNVIELRDGRRVAFAPNVNPGTAAVQDAIAHEVGRDSWLVLIGANGFRATYQKLFGDPMQFAIEPLVPADLKQPPLRLPFEDGRRWFFTGGPHAAWADGSARAALDFGTPDRGARCEPSEVWVIASAAGRVVASEHGRVMVALDGGDFQGAGWTVLYMHMATKDRPVVGTQLKVGDHVGHASCEGGASTAAHLHYARLYNGQWIPAADKQAPLNISGWVAKELPKEYEGYLVRNGEARMADAVRGKGVNAIYGEGLRPDLN